MIEIHVLSLMIGAVICVVVYPRFAGRFFESFRPWRRRVHWPSRGGIRGKGFVDLKRVRLPSGVAATRQLRIEVEKRIPPKGGSALPAGTTCDRCHKYSCSRKGVCTCPSPPLGTKIVSCRFTCPAVPDEPPVQPTTFVEGRTVWR